ncbi:uroporphyrinogen decarboxylase family protein [Chloroflexota bacterium]
MATVIESDINREKELKLFREQIEKRTGKTPEQLYEEREKRVMDTLQLREPDRVPVLTDDLCYFSLRQAGLPASTVYYDPELTWKVFVQATLDFEPDLWRGPRTYAIHSGIALEALDDKQIRWPGGTLPPDVTTQYIERDDMKEDEYDLFITDPTDFMIRRYLARIYGALECLPKIPPLGLRLLKSGFVDLTTTLSRTEFRKLARVLFKAGKEETKWRQVFDVVEEDLGSLGFPPFLYNFGDVANFGGIGDPPVDYIAVRLRGLRGMVTDMFRQPEKVILACERILEWQLARATPADPTQKWNPRRVGVGTAHYGSDDFMSKKQFETFYWPTWKKLITATIDLGYFPSVFFEGIADERLEYMLELPKGKFSVGFERVNMARAKAILGNHCGIIGGVPIAMLQTASPQEVEEHCKELIKACGKGGGFMLSCCSNLSDAKPANIRAMVDSVVKYGKY